MAIIDSYAPGRVPFSASKEIRNFLDEELNRIAQVLTSPFIFLAPVFAPPKQPVNGMIAYADGTQWNPGAGEGAYIYMNGVWQLMDSAKGFGGMDINFIPQPFTATTVYQIINVYQRILPASRPPYNCTPSVASSNITIDQGGLWKLHVGFSIFVPAAETIFLGIFVNGFLFFEAELQNTNQTEFDSGEVSGSGEASAGDVIDIRIRSGVGDAPLTFNRLLFDVEQMRTAL